MLQGPVYNRQVSSKIGLCSSYKICQFDSTPTLHGPVYNRHDLYLPKVNCVQAIKVSLILHIHYKDLCIIDMYLT